MKKIKSILCTLAIPSVMDGERNMKGYLPTNPLLPISSASPCTKILSSSLPPPSLGNAGRIGILSYPGISQSIPLVLFFIYGQMHPILSPWLQKNMRVKWKAAFFLPPPLIYVSFLYPLHVLYNLFVGFGSFPLDKPKCYWGCGL